MRKTVRNVEDLSAILRALQSQGKTVVYSGGVFDLVHGDHIRAIRNAKSRGDFLVIGVYDDAVVKRRVSPSLPIHPARDRADLIEALEPVDYVTVIRSDDTTEFLDKLRPDILVTGIDENPGESSEKAAVNEYGGKAVSVAERAGLSLMQVVRKIRRMPEAPPKSPLRTASGRSTRKTKTTTRSASKPKAKAKTKAKVTAKSKTKAASRAKSPARGKGKKKAAATRAPARRNKAAAKKTGAAAPGRSAASRSSKARAAKKTRSRKPALAGAS